MTVGITGNIGSGKTTVCKVFSALGVPVFQADEEAKKFYSEPGAQQLIREKFGEEVFDGETINYKKIASRVFKDKSLLDWLNRQIHPYVRKRFTEWKEEQPEAPYVIYEAAILFETGRYKEVDKVITVTAPKGLRLKRIMDRDGISEEDARARERNQWDQDRKVDLSDFVIVNDGNVMVLPQVLEIHGQLI